MDLHVWIGYFIKTTMIVENPEECWISDSVSIEESWPCKLAPTIPGALQLQKTFLE
jgi:hypothetical protein